MYWITIYVFEEDFTFFYLILISSDVLLEYF